jgi:hypothetical protein
MLLSQPGDLRALPPARSPIPSNPSPLHQGRSRWQKAAVAILVQAIALTLFWLGSWTLREWLATVPAIQFKPTPVKRGSKTSHFSTTPRDQLPEQERLKQASNCLVEATLS